MENVNHAINFEQLAMIRVLINLYFIIIIIIFLSLFNEFIIQINCKFMNLLIKFTWANYKIKINLNFNLNHNFS